MQAPEEVATHSRLTEPPIRVPIPRLIEASGKTDRRYPVGYEQMLCQPSVGDPLQRLRGQIETFLQRAVDEGAIRPGLPDGMAWSLFITIVHLVAHQLGVLDTGLAADFAAATQL